MASAKAAPLPYSGGPNTALRRAGNGLASERVEHDGAPGGRISRIEVPHPGSKLPRYSQNLGIARRERKRPLVGFTRVREVERYFSETYANARWAWARSGARTSAWRASACALS